MQPVKQQAALVSSMDKSEALLPFYLLNISHVCLNGERSCEGAGHGKTWILPSFNEQ